MRPLVSVIVPILADREAGTQLIAQIPVDPRAEVIVAEAGSDPGLEDVGQGVRTSSESRRRAGGRGR